MSHIYQPVMIKSLLINGGEMTTNNLAKEFLNYDVSQQEYYSTVVNKMVGIVLRKHDIVEKNKDLYLIKNFNELNNQEIQFIITECDNKINEFLFNRGHSIWEHRRRNRRAIPGSIRYEVLKRAHFRCELCGIPADEKALEVDHIIPKNLAGEDDIHNYQALCYTCNSQKRNLDDTDFRKMNELFKVRNTNCVFCSLDKIKIIYENSLAIGFFDNYPVTQYHLLIIPKRHANDYFELLQPEINAINDILKKAKSDIMKKDSSISAFNIGINCGEQAGQTIFHCHVHLIPRRLNDVDDPIGGIRNVIPGKGNYKKNAL